MYGLSRGGAFEAAGLHGPRGSIGSALGVFTL